MRLRFPCFADSCLLPQEEVDDFVGELVVEVERLEM
jgi:hypothetical protein